MEWLRLYTEITNDRKLRRLSPPHRWLWITMMCMARKSPVPGVLLLSKNIPANVEDLADEAAISVDDVVSGVEIFKAQDMLQEIDSVYSLINWDKRQFNSDNSTNRVKSWRAKQSETTMKRFSDVSVTPPDTDTDTDTEKDSSAFKGKPRSPFKNKNQESLFDMTWEIFPKKKSKGQAEKTWVKLNPDEQLVANMIATIKRAKTSREWLKDNGDFIPYLSTWLNSKGWLDEYSQGPVELKTPQNKMDFVDQYFGVEGIDSG